MSLDPNRLSPTERRDYDSGDWLGSAEGLLSPGGKVHAIEHQSSSRSGPDLEFTRCGLWAWLQSGWGRTHMAIDCKTCLRMGSLS